MSKQMMFDAQARAKIQKGVKALADAVKVTLGPQGRNVMFDRSGGKVQVSRDGVTVAKEVELTDPFENLGAQLVREVAQKTAKVAGDGTTTATVLAESIFNEGIKLMASGIDPVALRRGLDLALVTVLQSLEKQSRKVKSNAEAAYVGTVAAHHDEEIGKLMAQAFEAVGKDGAITIEDGKGTGLKVTTVDGLRFDKGYISPYFINNTEKLICEYRDAYVFLCEKKLSDLKELLPLLELVSRAGRPLLIVADDVTGEALAALIVNRLRGVLPVVAVKAPGFGDRRKAMLDDLAILSGGTFFSDDLGRKLEEIQLEELGRVERVLVEKENTTLAGGQGAKTAIEERARALRLQIEQATSEYDREKLEERLAKLSGGVAIIEVGGYSEAEQKERKDRVDDAMHATRAALHDGILPGGGVACLRAAAALKGVKLDGDAQHAVDLLRRVLEAPLRQIARNAGQDGGLIVDAVNEQRGAFGYDARTGRYGDLFELGIIDPLQVTRTALQNAVSVAGTMLATSLIVTDVKNKKLQPAEGAVR